MACAQSLENLTDRSRISFQENVSKIEGLAISSTPRIQESRINGLLVEHTKTNLAMEGPIGTSAIRQWVLGNSTLQKMRKGRIEDLEYLAIITVPFEEIAQKRISQYGKFDIRDSYCKIAVRHKKTQTKFADSVWAVFPLASSRISDTQ